MKLNNTLVKSTLVAGLGGLLFGFDTAVIAGCISAIQDLFSLSEGMKGAMVASALIGTIIGSFAFGKPADKFGRRNMLKWMGVLFFISAVGCAFSWDITSLVTFRLIGGLGVGGASVLGPMYIAEISPAKWRGRLVAFFQFNIVFGILVAYFSNFVVGLFELGLIEWRVKLGIEAVPALAFFLMLYTIPKSPRWLVKRGEIDAARHTLTTIGEQNVEKELQKIEKSVHAERGKISEPLFTKKYFTPIMLAVGIAVFNQFTGINVLLYYLNDIFSAAGFDKLSSDVQSVAVGATNFFFTILAMTVIDKVGRKLLLLIGAVGMAVTLSGVAYIFISNQHQNLLVWLLMTYIAFFAFSQGAVIWVYISEVFPNLVRAKGQALGSFTHWFMCAAITWTYPLMAETSGGYPFVFFAVMMVVQFFVVLAFFPETKGISLEEMQTKLKIQD